MIFERAEKNWEAYLPELPCCMATGGALDQSRINIREAIEGHLETLRASGDPIPQPASFAGEAEVTTAA